jgi:hypothetical protein
VSKSKHQNRNRHGRPGRGPRPPAAPPIHLTADGVPAAGPDAPPVSAVVFVADASLKAYPWLPPRVIAGSVWRGPQHERVRVDEQGVATPVANVRRLALAR